MSQSKKVLYQEMLPHEFVERVNACPIAYLPLGTLEFHSFHLPYGSDMIIPFEMFKRLAARVGGVVLPPLYLGPDGTLDYEGKQYYGMDYQSFQDGHPQHLIGSMHFIPVPFYLQIIEYIIKNLKQNGFAALIFFGHGPSADALIQSREYLENQFEMKLLSLTDMCSDGARGMPGDHAAYYETGMFMAVSPDIADLSLLPEDKPPVAVWGQDPRSATVKEEGERLIALYEEQAAAKLIELNQTLPKPDLNLVFNHVKDLRY